MGTSKEKRPPPCSMQPLHPQDDNAPREEGEAVPGGSPSAAVEQHNPPAKRVRKCGLCKSHMHDARCCPKAHHGNLHETNVLGA